MGTQNIDAWESTSNFLCGTERKRNVLAPRLPEKDAEGSHESNNDGKTENETINGGKKMKSDLDKHIERQMKDREFRIYFDKAEAKRKISQEVALLRKAQHITQAQLAKEIKTSQQVISRLESPRDKRMPSLELLARVAKALNKKLVISLQS